jgi:hypothetical protein
LMLTFKLHLLNIFFKRHDYKLNNCRYKFTDKIIPLSQILGDFAFW